MSRSRSRVLLVGLLLAMCVAYGALWHRCAHRSRSDGPTVDTEGAAHVEAHVETAPPTMAVQVPAATRAPRGAYKMRVIVFTYRRLDGLQRLLRSLVAADYLGHEVALTVFIDFAKKHKPLRDDGTRDFVAGFRWPHGPMTIQRRVANAGLKRTIMEAWFPAAHADEAVATFEDDIEVSPYWYAWATGALARYADPAAPADHAHLLGVSLYRPIHDELSGKGCVVHNGDRPFLLQQPCSWGAVFLPGPWRAFREWYDTYAEHDPDPTVHTAHGRPSSNTWSRHSSWKKYLIKLMHERGWFMVYHNLPGTASLSTNHLMEGEHPTPSRRLFELPLLDAAAFRRSFAGDPAAAFAATMPALGDLEVYDVMFHRVPSVAQLPGYGP